MSGFASEVDAQPFAAADAMRLRLMRPLIFAASLACYSLASLAGDGQALFNSDIISPKPVVWETSDWNSYTESTAAPYRRYSFNYPSEWSFTGYSVFEDAMGRKVAEISPGVVTLAKGQRCFEVPKQRALRYKSFRLGAVKGRVIVADAVFDDSPEKFRVYSYCIEQEHHAFVITFLDRKTERQLAKTFRQIIRSFKFAPNDA